MKKTNLKRISLIILFLLVLPVVLTWIFVAQPTITKNVPSHLTVESACS